MVIIYILYIIYYLYYNKNYILYKRSYKMSFEMDLIYGGVRHPCSNLIKFLYKSSAFIFDHNNFINCCCSNELTFYKEFRIYF